MVVVVVKTEPLARVVLVTRQAHLPHRGQLVGLGVLVEFLPLAAAAAAAVPLV